MIRVLEPTTCVLPDAVRWRLDGATDGAAIALGLPLPDDARIPTGPGVPTGLLVAVPGPGDARVWESVLEAECPALVHLGCELPRIEAWAAGLHGERDNRPEPAIWPWVDRAPSGPGIAARCRALQWWTEARTRRPPNGAPWHRVAFPDPRAAWAMLWREPVDAAGADGLAAARDAADAVVRAWLAR